MKFVLAPDSFKGTLAASEVCDIEARAIRELLPDAQVVAMPLADGGEGTLEALAHAYGTTARRIRLTVHDPLMRETSAEYLQLPDSTACVELAQASGLQRLRQEERNPLEASTYGTGELLWHALGNGNRKVIVGLGGSATVDGGLGLAQALGVKFLDKHGQLIDANTPAELLVRAHSYDIENAPWRDAQIIVASDVTSPLLGPDGAAAVFGPQKGATPEMVAELENVLVNWTQLWQDDGNQPGDGAAGGVGFLLRKLFPNCRTLSGGELICELAGLDRQLADADLVITGEGASDAQTLCGKLPIIVSRHAHNAAVPCALLSGFLPDTAKNSIGAQFQFCAGTLRTPPNDLELARERCAERLATATKQLILSFLNKNKHRSIWTSSNCNFSPSSKD